MTNQNATPAAAPAASIPARKLDTSAQRVDSVADDLRIEAVMRLADDYAEKQYLSQRFGGHYSDDRDAARNALRAAIASQLAATQVASGWMAIESAPKDGSSVLLGRFVPGKDRHGYQSVDFWHTTPKNDFVGWGRFNATYWPATHWQPLPAAPTSQQPTQEGV